jgi:signal transduction histidine kinase/ligand-binding sensor domain-containing protein
VLSKANRKLGRLLILAWLVVIALLAAACRGSTSLTSLEASPQFTATGPVPSAPSVGQAPLARQALLPLSAGQRLRFERISLEQGLSQSTVFCMLQDSQGFMWFGTEDGLNRYDGYTFTIYKHDPEDPNSLGNNWIQALLEDDSGTLWIGTNDGLDRYDRKLDQFIHYRNDPQDPSSLSADEITAIYQDRDGVLWIGTGGGGLNRLVLSAAEGVDQENERFVHYQHDPDDPHSLSSNAVSVIYKGQEGELWIGTEDGGLNRLVLSEVEGFERENERWWHYVNDPGDPDSLSHNTIQAISEDPSGALWVGTGGGGLDRLDQENERFIHYQHDPDDPGSLSSDDITAIYQDWEGVLWIGTYGGGLNRLDPEKETFAHYQNVPGDPHSLSSNLVLSIFQDREGVLWFGTIGGGVNKLDVGRWNFAHYKNDPNDPNSLGDNMVRAFFQDREGDLWIGTMFGGLDRFDRETGIWHHYRHDADDPGSLSNNFVSAIYRDRSDVLWIGTASGLDRFNPETDSALREGTFTHYQADPDAPPGSLGNNVRTIYEGQAGEFWIGTKGGLYRFDREEKSWCHTYYYDPGDPHSPSDDWVFSFLEDREGRLWIGTFGGGLYRFDLEKETFAHYQNVLGDPHSLSNNLVVSIVQDRKGTLWFGTGGGFDKLVPSAPDLRSASGQALSEAEGFDPGTETFTHYREKDGLPNDSVYCMVQDGQGYLWVSTNKGLSRFDPQSETFKNYDVTDGLQSNEFNSIACLVGDSGEMFFGGINGFNTFFPDRLQDNPTVPPVVLTSLTHGGEEVNLGHTVDSMTEVTLEWPDNAFEFEFAALSFAHPEKNQYAYYLEGFEETWNDVGTRRYGQYTNLPGGTYTLRVKGSNNDGVWNEAGTALNITVVPPFWATWWFRGIVLLVLVGGAFGGYRLRVRRLEARGRELESQVNHRTKELAALNAVASVVSRSLDLQEILSSALDKTLEVIGTEAGGIYLLQQDTQVLTIAAHEGLSAQFVAEIDNLKVGEGFSGQVAETGEPLVVQDVSIDPRLTRSVARESGFHALGIVPLLSRANVVGTLFVATHGRREFSPQEVELLAAIGAPIGVAVENARLYEQAQQVAVVEERQRLARDLHDSVTQSLHSATLMAEAGQRLAGAGDLERTKHYLTRLGEISQQALKEMRLMVYELRPLALRKVGLVGALQQRLDAVERRAGVDARLVVVGSDPGDGKEVELPAAVEEALYRIAQEALNNALKHGQPSSVTVALRIEGPLASRRVELEVVDDGRGFEPNGVDGAGGIGLVSMRERAEKMGGRLTVHSAPGEGMRVRVSVELKEISP